MEENKGNSFNAAPQVQFPEVIKIEPCTSNHCANGHKWPAQVALAGCPGCGAAVLMVRMVNCPVCNEPTKRFVLRTDHTNQGWGVAAICRGQQGAAETNVIELERHASEEVAEKWDETTGRMK